MKKKALRTILIVLIFLLVLPTSVYAYETCPEGMVSYWKFDEGSGDTAVDSVGTNHGTIYGAVRTIGMVNGGLSFDGNEWVPYGDDYVNIPDDDSLDFGAGQDFSLEAWIKAETEQESYQGQILAKLTPYGHPAGKRAYGYAMMVRGVQDNDNRGKIGF